MDQQQITGLKYSQLARAEAFVERQVKGHEMCRLSRLCVNLQDFAVGLSFGLTTEENILVDGKACGAVQLACHRCAGIVDSTISVKIDALVFESESQAQDWLADREKNIEKDVVVSGPILDIVELIEDELILQLPRVVCPDCESPTDEVYVYSAGQAEEKVSPFSDLSNWKSN